MRLRKCFKRIKKAEGEVVAYGVVDSKGEGGVVLGCLCQVGGQGC